MIKLKKAAFSFLGLLLLTSVPLAYAQNDQGTDEQSQKWHNGQKIQQIYGQLGLTDEQKKLLEANKQQHRAKIKSARQEMKANKEALRAELMRPQLDMTTINAIQGQIKVLLSEMEDDNLNSILAVRSILTPDQFLKFINMMHRHKQERD